MRFFKYLTCFTLVIFMFLNLWRFLFGQEGTAGYRFVVDYVSTYRGWQSTVDTFNYMYSLSNVDNAGEGILLILSPLWAPVAIGLAILADIIYHIAFFFGFIGTTLFSESLTTDGSSYDVDIFKPFNPFDIIIHH